MHSRICKIGQTCYRPPIPHPHLWTMGCKYFVANYPCYNRIPLLPTQLCGAQWQRTGFEGAISGGQLMAAIMWLLHHIAWVAVSPSHTTKTAGTQPSRRKSISYNQGILPKGPYLPCVSMAGRALLAGHHRLDNMIQCIPQYHGQCSPKIVTIDTPYLPNMELRSWT